MIGLYLYRIVVFLVSGASHYAALYALLWFGQVYGRNEGLLTGEYVYSHVDLAVIAAGMQGLVFLVMVSPLAGLFQSVSMPVRRMSKREAEVLEPLMKEVLDEYENKKMQRIKRINLRIQDDTDSNAYAFGKNTIVLTTGFFREFRWRPDIIKGVIGHELGHLHHRDIRYWQYVVAAGGIFTFLQAVLRAVSAIASILAGVALPLLLVSLPLMMAQFVMDAVIYVIRIPERLLDLLSVFFSRAEEYRADRFAADIIGAKGIVAFLESVGKAENFNKKGFLVMQRRSHPPSELRLEKLFDHPDYEGFAKELPARVVWERPSERTRQKRAPFIDKGFNDDFSQFI